MIAFVLLALYGAIAAWYLWSHGYSYYYGDAEAHLNIARRIFDSRTPGPEQIGTVWLPLPHILFGLFAFDDSLWISGLAGVIPSVLCFALAGAFLYAATQRALGSSHAALAATLLFASNPTMLYLQSTPMTEPIMAATIAALLLVTLWYRDTQSIYALLLVAVASNAASLTRYEGWFLIPILTLYIWIIARNKQHAYLFALLAALAPISWFAHNLYYFGDALAFYNGPYSAHAITAKQVADGMVQPGTESWTLAATYYGLAVRHVIGLPLLLAAAAGFFAALFKRAWWPLFFLGIPAAFYVWSVHSAGTPVFVPELEPFTRYNTRFAVVLLPFAAFAAAALVAILPNRARTAAAFVLMLGAVFGELRFPTSITWEEARIASEDRRAWTAEAAAYMKENYRPGAGIVFWFSDVVPIFRQAGIPIREGLFQDNSEAWKSAVAQPEVFQKEEWALTREGDPVDQMVQKQGPAYQVAKRIAVKGAPAVLIYRRSPVNMQPVNIQQ
ncbi:MAG: glycosyltransferase family 39 protein [Bryobacteraceae bacterium]